MRSCSAINFCYIGTILLLVLCRNRLSTAHFEGCIPWIGTQPGSPARLWIKTRKWAAWVPKSWDETCKLHSALHVFSASLLSWKLLFLGNSCLESTFFLTLAILGHTLKLVKNCCSCRWVNQQSWACSPLVLHSQTMGTLVLWWCVQSCGGPTVILIKCHHRGKRQFIHWPDRTNNKGYRHLKRVTIPHLTLNLKNARTKKCKCCSNSKNIKLRGWIAPNIEILRHHLCE